MKTFTYRLITAALAALMVSMFAACGPNYQQRLEVPNTPKYINTPARAVTTQVSDNGSLYVDGSRVAQINDFRAYNINDLVTIKVVESTVATNTANMSTDKKDSSQRGITSLLGLQDKLLPRSVNPASAIDADTQEEFESTGSNRRAEALTSTLTARVTDRLPNGNLIIQAVREIIVNNERQVMVVQGIIRPVDIDDSNSVLSTKISDLQIQYGGSGILSENLRRGWFSRIVHNVWPF